VAEVGTSKITRGQGSHNKPIGCGASGAHAPGPDDEEKELRSLCLPLVPTEAAYEHYHLPFIHSFIATILQFPSLYQ